MASDRSLLRLVEPPAEDEAPTFDELREALHSPGLLMDQPVIQRLMRAREIHRRALAESMASRETRPNLTLVPGDDAA